MTRVRHVWLLGVAPLLLTQVACSTYQVYDAYQVGETGKAYISFDSDKTHASLSFLPEQKLYSIGVLGVPAIPVFAGAKPASTLALSVELTMKENNVFSFESSPC